MIVGWLVWFGLVWFFVCVVRRKSESEKNFVLHDYTVSTLLPLFQKEESLSKDMAIWLTSDIAKAGIQFVRTVQEYIERKSCSEYISCDASVYFRRSWCYSSRLLSQIFVPGWLRPRLRTLSHSQGIFSARLGISYLFVDSFFGSCSRELHDKHKTKKILFLLVLWT